MKINLIEGNDYIILEAYKPKLGAIVLPPNVQENKQKAIVHSAPAGSGLKKGDVVMFAAVGGFAFKLEGKEYLAVKKEYLVCTIDENLQPLPA